LAFAPWLRNAAFLHFLASGKAALAKGAAAR
jgi:hypothetical protein